MSNETSGGEGTFRLEIQISGLCLFLWSEDGTVDLVMADARNNRPDRPAEPAEGDPKPHVGYLRFDLASLQESPAPPADPLAAPRYEVVHRFDRERLHLEIGESQTTLKQDDLDIPDFSEFAPDLETVPGARDGSAPEVLMHTTLRGGTFRTVTDGVMWKIPGVLHPEGKDTVREFGGEVYWTREVAGDSLPIRIEPLDGGESVEMRLYPFRQGDRRWLRLKLANLCDNPLEWDELTTPGGKGPDADFRWLYRLMQSPKVMSELDYPVPVPQWIPQEGMLQECFSAQVSRPR